MLNRDRHRAAHRVWSWIAAAAVVVFLLAVSAAPMAAAGPTGPAGPGASKIQLTGVSVAPRTGTPKTTIVISVVATGDKGPAGRVDRVTATIGGKDYPMTRLPGGAADKGGVKFRWSGTLPLGTYAITLTAKGRGAAKASVGAGNVTIKNTTTTETKPTTPKATQKPAVRTTTRPTTVKKPTVVAVVAKPSPTAEAPVVDTAAAGPAADPPIGPFTAAAMAALIPDTVDPGSGPGGSGPGGPVGGDPGGPGAGGNGPHVPVDPSSLGGGGRAKAWGPLASVFAVVGFHPPTFPPLSLAPTLVTTSGAVATAMAFGLFGRRRRDDDIADDVLAAAAATGIGVGPERLVGAGVPIEIPASGIGANVTDRSPGENRQPPPIDPRDDEALLPRWRRPSLLQARKADPTRDSMQAAPRLTFGQGLVGPLAGHERRVIRYRVVRLLDSPDELRGAEIGYLDEGDEVQLLEKYGAYWLVQSPDGQQGWLHKMVLGEIVDGDGASGDVPVATMPTVAESWTMGESDIDSDVFDAYLEARRRAG